MEISPTPTPVFPQKTADFHIPLLRVFSRQEFMAPGVRLLGDPKRSPKGGGGCFLSLREVLKQRQ